MEAIIGDFESKTQRFNPFPGLRPFEPDEDHLFFGRERETDELLRRLRTHRFVSVLGTSGSGKSSLVRSGLIPSLYSGFMVKAGSDWRVAILRPGDDPIGNLARALDHEDVLGGDGDLQGANRMLMETTLRRSTLGLADCARHARLGGHENLLVVVDQFEELFRFRESRRVHGSRDEAIAFAKLLLGAAGQEDVSVYVVITMRSDFIGDCMEYPGLPEAVNQGQYLIPRMTRDELRHAITGPAAVGGGEIAPRLVARLLNEVGDDPDQLPVLQHALMRTWDHWETARADGQPVDLDHYDSIGTMAEALSRHAEEAYGELPEGRPRRVAEQMFKALTDKRKDDRGVRRPTAVREVAAIADVPADEVIRVVEVFRKPGRSFLMPPAGTELGPDSILDLSHESLMRNWARLVEWVDEETQSGKAFRRLCRAARRYREGEAGLWVDPELSLGLKWRDESGSNEAWAARYDPDHAAALAFLDESKAAHDARIEAAEQERRAKLRRARILAGVLGSAALITLAFGLFAVRAGRIARQAEQVATLEAQKSAAVTDFLVDLFEVADPEEARGASITAQEILDEGARKIDTELAGQPEVQARMMATIGKVYGSLGLYDKARPILERAVETSTDTLGADHPDTLAARHRLATSYLDQGKYKEAESLFEETLAGRRNALGDDDPATLETLAGLGRVHQEQGKFFEAEEAMRSAWEGQRVAVGDEDKATLRSASELATTLKSLGRLPETEELLVSTLEAQRRTLGEDHPDTIATMGTLGELYSGLGRYDEAEELYADNLARRREVFGDDHPKTLTALSQLAQLDYDRGRWDSAEARRRTVLEGRRRALGDEHPSTLREQSLLGSLLVDQGKGDEALALTRSAHEAAVRVLGEDHPKTLEIDNSLAIVLRDKGLYNEGEKLNQKILEVRERLYGKAHPATSLARNNLAAMYSSWGRMDRTDELISETLRINREMFGDDHPETLFYTNNMLIMHANLGRWDEYEALAFDNLERHQRVLGNDHPQTFTALERVAVLHGERRRFDELEATLEELIAGNRRVFGEDHPETLDALGWLAGLYQGTDRIEEAVPIRERILEGRRRFYGEGHIESIGAHGALAWVYENTGRDEEGLELRRQAHVLRKRLADRPDAGPEDVHRYAAGRTYGRRGLQDKDDALKYALRAAEMTDYENRNYLGTLANAYFLNGMVDEAIETQKRGIALLTEDDEEARSGWEGRLAEFYRATGDETLKRQAQIDELARERERAMKPDASPAARNDYVWELLTADPDDLQDPEEALKFSLEVNEAAGYAEIGLLNNLAIAYHMTGQSAKAVEIQQKIIGMTPENEIFAIESNEAKLMIFRGEVTRDVDLAEVLPGTWHAKVGTIELDVRWERRDEYLVAVNQRDLPWVPAGEVWFRVHPETGEMEEQISDSGWTNLRWRKQHYGFAEGGDWITWNPYWQVGVFRKQ